MKKKSELDLMAEAIFKNLQSATGVKVDKIQWVEPTGNVTGEIMNTNYEENEENFDEDEPETDEPETDELETEEVKKVAPVQISEGEVVPSTGGLNVPLLAVMDGRCDPGTYIVAAVKGENGILAVRAYPGEARLKVKFYPDLEYWDISDADLVSLGAQSHYNREYYQGTLMTKPQLQQLLAKFVEVIEQQKIDEGSRFKVASIRILKSKFHAGTEEGF